MSGRDPWPVQPLQFDLSEMVGRSVATLYSHLVTRPTGQALRLGIESQIGEVGAPCISILDFRQVVVMDYSCADEAVAKLLQHYARAEAAEVYFFARGLRERHSDTIDAVLVRHGLALVAQFDDQGVELLGPVTAEERGVWEVLESRTRGSALELAAIMERPPADLMAILERLTRRRVAVRLGRAAEASAYLALSSLLPLEEG